MKERPILFSDAMVRAILEGRKTQTRRVIKPQPTGEPRPLSEWSRGLAAACHDHDPDPVKLAAHSERMKGRIFPFMTDSGGLMSPVCPHGQPGDLLWVRESGWEPKEPSPRELREGADTWPKYEYDADGLTEADADQFKQWGWRRRPSIHMPRWASRITLRLTDVRVERVQDISESDAIAEGITGPHDVGYKAYRAPDDSKPRYSSAIAAFEALWDSINAERGFGWGVDPWVWVLAFESVRKETA